MTPFLVSAFVLVIAFLAQQALMEDISIESRNPSLARKVKAECKDDIICTLRRSGGTILSRNRTILNMILEEDCADDAPCQVGTPNYMFGRCVYGKCLRTIPIPLTSAEFNIKSVICRRHEECPSLHCINTERTGGSLCY